MDQDEYDDYLVDKAKEILNNQVSDTEVDDVEDIKGNEDELDENSDNKIPAAFDPREIEHLTKNRKKMSNSELKEFLKRESDLQDELEEVDDWNGFSRWEERFMIQNNLSKNPDEIAEELGRDEKEVRLKMRLLGLDVDF